MKFVIDLLISTDYKDKSYNLILVIINYLIKIVYYKLIKIMINALSLAEVIINIVIYHHRILESIVIDQSLLFMSKF